MNMTHAIRTSMLAVALSALTSHAMAGGAKLDGALAPPLPSVTVHFDDLNMSTPDGGKALLARIHAAASRVCHTTAEWYPTTWGSYRDCYRATMDRVVSRLNLPQLTALYAQEQHGLPANTLRQAQNRR